MKASSRPVVSAQEGPHRDLAERVGRHLEHPWQKPILEHNRQAFDAAVAAWRDWNGEAPLLLDSGCGVGCSTLQLASRYSDHFVVGIDQSLDRLQRGKPLPVPANVVFVRAELADFWRLLHAAQLGLSRHYLLYPNPWPKIGHLARRWHGHPVFPALLALGGRLECRSNWKVYVDELAAAIALATGRQAEVETLVPDSTPLTPFEAKYQASGHALYRLVADLSPVAGFSRQEGEEFRPEGGTS